MQQVCGEMLPPSWNIWTLQFHSIFAQQLKLCQALFQTQPQTLDVIHILALRLWGRTAVDRVNQPPFFWMRDQTDICGPSDSKVTSPFTNLIFLEGFTHSFIFLLRVFLSKNLSMILCLKASRKKKPKLVGGVNIICSCCNTSKMWCHCTVTAIFAVGDSSWVSIDDVQEEVGGVVVGFTGVSFQMKIDFRYVVCRQCWSNKNIMFIPMSEKYSKALCAGPW